MTIYTVALLVRTVADGLGAVPDDVNQAATAMGYTPGRAVLRGRAAAGRAGDLRRAAGGRGEQRQHRQRRAPSSASPSSGCCSPTASAATSYDPIVVGIIACVVLALLLRRRHRRCSPALLTPWQRATGGRA